MIRIAFIGDFQVSEDYPNTKNFISALENDDRFEVRVSSSASSGQQRYSESGNILKKLAKLWRMILSARKSAKQISEIQGKDCEIVYVPYPAILCVYFLALKKKRSDTPSLVIDCFISIYDTMVQDRKIISPGNPLALLIRHLERKAMQRADLVLTDTVANADYLARLYRQAQNKAQGNKFRALNLCINESLFLRGDEPADRIQSAMEKSVPIDQSRLKVLFVGSFVPLQGVEVIIEAASILRKQTQIEFTLLGDGQTANEIQRMLEMENLEIDWQRGWHSIGKIAEAIAGADICLGVFGAGGKAKRVLPYKIYMAMASGKPVISTRMDEGVSPVANIPLVMLEQGTGQQLAEAIQALYDSVEERRRLGSEARAFYRQYLSNSHACGEFLEMAQSLLAVQDVTEITS